MPNKLKPCPFCGEENNLKIIDVNNWFVSVECQNCGAMVPTEISDKEATEVWNRRAE